MSPASAKSGLFGCNSVFNILLDCIVSQMTVNSFESIIVFVSSYVRIQCQLHNTEIWAISLTYCGLVTPYGDRELGQHWLR